MAKKYHSGLSSNTEGKHNSHFPDQVIIKDHSDPHSSLEGGMWDDSMEGVDAQISLDKSKIRGGFKPKKI